MDSQKNLLYIKEFTSFIDQNKDIKLLVDCLFRIDIVHTMEEEWAKGENIDSPSI